MECKICKSNSNTLISTSKCMGTIGYVHKNCLNTWVKTSGSNKCPECREIYASKLIYTGILFQKLTLLVINYNSFIRYFKIMLLMYILYGAIILPYILTPLLFTQLNATTLSQYILLQYILFYAISFFLNNVLSARFAILGAVTRFVRARSFFRECTFSTDKIGILRLIGINLINMCFTYYHHFVSPEGTACFANSLALTNLYTYDIYHILNLIIGLLGIYQKSKTSIVYTDR